MDTAASSEQMTLDAYQVGAVGTAFYPGQNEPIGLIYCALKMTGESGEFAEKVGKAIRDDGYAAAEAVLGGVAENRADLVWGDPLTNERREALAKELGDVLWYVAAAAKELGLTLGGVAQMNLDKLADRAARGVLQGSGDNR